MPWRVPKPDFRVFFEVTTNGTLNSVEIAFSGYAHGLWGQIWTPDTAGGRYAALWHYLQVVATRGISAYALKGCFRPPAKTRYVL